MATHDPYLRRTLLEVVDNQLRENNPKETQRTLDRLIQQGFTRERARELIACVVSQEIFDVLKSGQVFQEDRYVAALQALPSPWESTKQA